MTSITKNNTQDLQQQIFKMFIITPKEHAMRFKFIKYHSLTIKLALLPSPNDHTPPTFLFFVEKFEAFADEFFKARRLYMRGTYSIQRSSVNLHAHLQSTRLLLYISHAYETSVFSDLEGPEESPFEQVSELENAILEWDLQCIEQSAQESAPYQVQPLKKFLTQKDDLEKSKAQQAVYEKWFGANNNEASSTLVIPIYHGPTIHW